MIQVAKRYIRMGIAKDLSKPSVATPLENGLFEMHQKYSVLVNHQFRNPHNGDLINSMAVRKSDKKIIGALDESMLWGSPDEYERPFWEH